MLAAIENPGVGYAFTGRRANEPSGLAVVRSYEKAVRKVAGTILHCLAPLAHSSRFKPEYAFAVPAPNS